MVFVTPEEYERMQAEKGAIKPKASPKNPDNQSNQEVSSEENPGFFKSFFDQVLKEQVAPVYKFGQSVLNAPESISNAGQYLADYTLENILGKDKLEELQSKRELTEANRKDPLANLEDWIAEKQYGFEQAIKPETPRQEFFQGLGKHAGDFVGGTPFLLKEGSALKELAAGATFGIGSESAKQAGYGGLGQFISGVGTSVNIPGLFRAGKNMLKGIYEKGRSVFDVTIPDSTPKFLTEQSKKSLADLKIHEEPIELTKRIAKTSKSQVETFDKALKDAAPIPTETFNASKIEKSLINENKNAILDTITTSPNSKKAAWEFIAADAKKNDEVANNIFKEAYDSIYDQAQGIKTTLNDTAQEVNKLRTDLNKSLLRAPEEESLRTTTSRLQKAVKNKKAEYAEELKSIFETDLKTLDLHPMEIETIQGDIQILKEFIESNPGRTVTLDRAMATKRSISRLLSKSKIIPAPVDLLNRVNKGLKSDIARTLEDHPYLQSLYYKTEKAFGEYRDVFDSEAIQKLLKSETPENLSSFMKDPSNLEKLDKTLYTKEAKDLSDRMIVEYISSQPTNTAKELAREAKPYISSEASKALDTLIETGNSLDPRGAQSAMRYNILEDVQKATSTGTTPKYTKQAMLTKQGYKIVKDTLNRSPAGKQLFKSLQKSVLDDAIASIINDAGVIDYSKISKMLENPQIKNIAVDLLGFDGLKMISQMESYGRNFVSNVSNLLEDPKALQLFNKYTKAFLYSAGTAAMLGSKKGFGFALGAEATKYAANRYYKAKLSKMLIDPKSQQAIKTVANKTSSKSEKIKALVYINKALQEDE